MEQIGEVEYRPSPADNCKCVIGWVDNERLAGQHKLAPVSCRSYVALLEEKIRAMSSADNQWLEDIQKTLVGYSVDNTEAVPADQPCQSEMHSWAYFDSKTTDSYWMKCSKTGPHDEHEDRDSGATWKETVLRNPSWDSPDANPMADLKNWKARIEADYGSGRVLCEPCGQLNHNDCTGDCPCLCRACLAHGPGIECAFCTPPA